jgi:hypothetical protein
VGKGVVDDAGGKERFKWKKNARERQRQSLTREAGDEATKKIKG